MGSPLPFSTAYCLSCLLPQRPLHTLLRTLQVTAGIVSTVPLTEGSAEARPTPSPSGSLLALDPYQELPLHLAYPQFLSTCKQGPHLSATTSIRLCIKVKSPQVLLPLGWVGALADAVWTNAQRLLSRVSESTFSPSPVTHSLGSVAASFSHSFSMHRSLAGAERVNKTACTKPARRHVADRSSKGCCTATSVQGSPGISELVES